MKIESVASVSPIVRDPQRAKDLYAETIRLSFEGGVLALLLVAAIFGVVNAVVRPLVTLLSIPLLVLTLGLFSLVINALMFGLTIWLADALGLGLSTTGFGPTFLGALVLAVIGWLLNLIRD
jgi:putative membrane protein